MMDQLRTLLAPAPLLPILRGAASAVVLALPLTAQVQGNPADAPADPFLGGPRWNHGPAAAEPWLPRDVAFTAGGELLFAGATLGRPHVALYASSALIGHDAPLFTSPELTGALGVLPVAGTDAAHLYAAAQFPAPDASHRRTEVSRYNGLAAGAGAGFAPTWTHVLPAQTNGPVMLGVGADAAVVAVHDNQKSEVHLAWLDPRSGKPLATAALAGSALSALAVAGESGRVAVTAGPELWIVEPDGVPVHHETLSAATSCLAIAADGGTVVVGGFSAARVLVAGAAGFADAAPITAGPSTIAARAAVSADGSGLAVGFWDYTSGADVRLIWRDAGVAQDLDVAWSGPAGLQNYPQELGLTPDGSRLAAALWGQGAVEPEVVVFDRGADSATFAWSLPGSPLAMDFAPDGTRVALAMKHSHANLFATTGDVVLVDTGEREIQLTGSARPGGTLSLAHHEPGALQTVFGVGFRGPFPVALPGIEGALLLDISRPLLSFAAPSDGAGRADLVVALPSDPAVVGLPLFAQAVALAPGAIAFSTRLAAPVIL